MLDSQVREKFKLFQEHTGKYSDLKIENINFSIKYLRDLHQSDMVSTQNNTTADKFIEIGDIDRVTKKYDISNKVKANLPARGKHAPKNTILISRVRPLLGGYTIIDGNDYTFTSGDLNPIVLPKSINVEYVFKIICSPKFEIFLKKNQDTAGQKPTITKKLYDFDIPIPKDFNNKYTSYEIQKIIVEFLEFWKSSYTDVFRQKIEHQKPILKKIERALIPATMKGDKFIAKNFESFAKERDIAIKLNDISFEYVNFFKEKIDDLFLPKKLEPNQGLILENASDKGVPVYSGASEPICYVEKSLYENKVFTPNPDNPDISFANNGDGSAGRNFFIHYNEYFVNQERTVISFKNDSDYYSLYIYYQIRDMREKYNMNRENRPTPKDLPKLNLKIGIPIHSDYKSIEIQKLLVEFWECIFNDLDEKFNAYEQIVTLTDKLDHTFLYRTFNKIDWKEEVNE